MDEFCCVICVCYSSGVKEKEQKSLSGVCVWCSDYKQKNIRDDLW